MVPKKDGSWWPCCDYHHLNLVTTPDKYPLPDMQDPFNGLHCCTIFLKIDLVTGYHQIPVATEDIPKTAIIMPFDLFEYLFTFFGLFNAALTFKRMMDCTTDCLEGVFAYMDKSRVGSPDRQTNLHHLEAFFKALAANGLAINLEKCVFVTPSESLGHTISATGAAPTELEWTVSAQEAFQNAKLFLAAAVPLQHPSPNADLSLATDASDTHIGWVMQQFGFFYRKLADTESCYSTFDHELLAAHAAIKHFCHFCKGRALQLWTDHKPLVTAISHVSAPISPRQQCHLAFISEFNVQLLYLPGLKNVVADFLSRPSQTTTRSVTA